MNKAPTKRELAAALGRMHSFAEQLYSCYTNDRQPNRAQAMQSIHAKVVKEAEILWRLPPEYGS